MANAIRVNVTGQAYDDVVLNMVIRENFDIYRGTHDIIMNAIAVTTGANISTEETNIQISQAIYDARMNTKSHIVVEGANGIEYQVHMVTGEESILYQM